MRPQCRCKLVEASERRRHRDSPTVQPPRRPGKACTQATVTVSPDLAERDRQKFLYGTTAWRSAYASRSAVESSNAQLKSNVLSLERGDMHMMGRDRHQLFATVSALAVNIHNARTFRISHLMPDPEWGTPAPPAPKQTRRKRRIQLTTA